MADININGILCEFVNYGVYSGLDNMRIDSELLDRAISDNSSKPVLRLYGWKPACISLGRNQDDGFIDKFTLEKYKLDCVRRLTGGRALLHDKELTYSFVCPISYIENGESIIESYKYISGLWIDIFKTFGIELTIGGLERHITKNNYCMSISTGADLCYEGKKFIGSAQYRKNGYILQHGSILIDYDKEFLDNIFQEHTDFSSIISLNEINPNITIEKICDFFHKLLI